MSTTLDQIRSNAMKLTIEERAILTAELAESITPEMDAERVSEIDRVLLSRSEGPFISFDPDDGTIWKGFQEEALRRAAQERHA